MTDKIMISFIDTDPPEFKRFPYVGKVIQGKPAVLECEGDGNPPVRYEWLKVGSVLHINASAIYYNSIFNWFMCMQRKSIA